MSTKPAETKMSTIEVITHYQKSIERSFNDPDRLLHCVEKLSKLPLTLKHLEITGVGKTVNNLRHHGGRLGDNAKCLVLKWKVLVEQSEEIHDVVNAVRNAANSYDSHKSEAITTHDATIEINAHKQSSSNSKQHHGSRQQHEEHERHEKRSDKTSSSTSRHHNRREDKHKTTREEIHKHKNDGESRKRKSKESDSKKNEVISHKEMKLNEDHGNQSGSGGEDVRTEKTKSSHRHKSENNRHSKKDDRSECSSSSKRHSSSHKHHASASSSSKASENDNTIKKTADMAKSSENVSSSHKRSAKTDEANDTRNSKELSDGNESKRRRVDKDDENDGDADGEGIDSSMGANFADVLGMLDMPLRKSKKSAAASKTSPNSQKTSSNNKNAAASSSSTSTAISTTSRNTNVLSHKPSTSKAAAAIVRHASPQRILSPPTPPPLDHSSILSEIPIITNNYKPMPLSKTVMECVFSDPEPMFMQQRNQAKRMTDDETLAHSMSSKTMRTKIYSGVRSGQKYHASSLFDLCIRVLQKNINDIEYTGGVPYDVLKPILEKATPEQLYQLEFYNPYLLDDTDKLWKFIVQRTYRTQKREEDESWRQMYLRCREDAERKLSAITENIKHLNKTAIPVRKTQLAYVDAPVKPPRSVQRKQEQYGTKSKPIATPAARVAALSAVTPNAVPSGDARLRALARAPGREGRDPAQSSPRAKKTAPLMMKAKLMMNGGRGWGKR